MTLLVGAFVITILLGVQRWLVAHVAGYDVCYKGVLVRLDQFKLMLLQGETTLICSMSDATKLEASFCEFFFSLLLLLLGFLIGHLCF